MINNLLRSQPIEGKKPTLGDGCQQSALLQCQVNAVDLARVLPEFPGVFF